MFKATGPDCASIIPSNTTTSSSQVQAKPNNTNTNKSFGLQSQIHKSNVESQQETLFGYLHQSKPEEKSTEQQLSCRLMASEEIQSL